MKRAFVDTSGWAALFVQHDRWHALAKDIFSRLFRESWELVTTNYVLLEVASLLTRPLRVARSSQLRILGEIRSASWVNHVFIDPKADQLGWELWAARSDKEWSHVDCVSFVTMQRLGIQEAITTDHHFEQAGFSKLLI